MKKGKLFVITAPSGAGKSSLIRALLKDDPTLKLSTSYTTRAPRPGEQNGREYHFVDERTFLAMRERGEFLESDLLLEIDWQGARQVRKLHPDCVGIFILPPSIEELERRMRTRGQDADAVIQRRMENAREELAHAGEFNYAIINKDFETAKQELAAILLKERNPHGPHHR
jgi:guanylate kinase